MNILKLQDDLKNFSQQQLVMEMQRPSGNVPQFLVLSELSRRKRMRAEQDRAEAADAPTVAQETVAAAGMPMDGVTQMARAMAPNTSMTENTGIAAIMPKQPTRMAEGGVVKMQRAGLAGGTISAIAYLKVNYPKLYEAYKDDPEELALVAAEKFEKDMETAEDSKSTALEQLETPRTNLQKIMDFAKYSPLRARKNMEKIAEGDKERELQARQETLQTLRDRDKFYIGADPILNDGGFSEQLKGTVMPVPLAEDPLKFIPPNNMSGPSVAMDRPLNMSDVSQPELGPMFPSVSSNRPPAQPTNLPVNTSPTFTSMLPNISQGDVGVGGKPKEDIIRSLLAGENPFETGVPLELQADAAADLNRRAREFYNADTYTPPEMIYSGDVRDILKREEATPEEIQAASDLLANQAAADEATKTQESLKDLTENKGLGADAAAAVREGALRRLQDQMQPTLVEGVNIPEQDQSLLVDAGELALKGAGKVFEGLTGDYFKDRASLIANQIGSDVKDFFTGDPVVTDEEAAKQRQEAAAEQADNILEQLKLDSEKTSAAASKADLSLSEYIKGLDKDRESSKWLAVARMGAELMKPSATIGEGIGKSVSVGAKDLQEGKKAYNKSKLTVLGLQARIDAAKAKSGALTTNQRFTQGLKFAEEARKLKEAAMLSNPPNLDQLGQAEAYEQVAASLLGMPSTSGSTVKAPSAR
tara:strand:+ start:1821 stop:3929 length:2109 start_codon:yes stop_codon:yes gene_type:complete